MSFRSLLKTPARILLGVWANTVSVLPLHPFWRPFWTFRAKNDDARPFRVWDATQWQACNGAFRGFNHDFAYLQGVVLDADRCRNVGGRYQVDQGFFQLGRATTARYELPYHMNHWMAAMTPYLDDPDQAAPHADFTIAVMRYEPSNLFHALTDLYNAYLVSRYLGMKPEETDILMIDGFSGKFDDMWRTLFRNVRSMREFKGTHCFSKLAFNIAGYTSPLSKRRTRRLPLLGEFSEYVLRRYGHKPQRRRDPQAPVRITLIWRHDYVGVSQHSDRTLSRKIANEEEILHGLRAHYPSYVVEGVLLESMDVASQISFIATTDILIGMHGAGLGYALVLPPWAGLLELFPRYFSIRSRHFMNVAVGRKLRYARWVNVRQKYELEGQRTFLPLRALTKRIDSLLVDFSTRAGKAPTGCQLE